MAVAIVLLIFIVIAGGFAWRAIQRNRGDSSDGSKAKLRGEIMELYCDAPYPPHGADYALVLKVALTSLPPISASIKAYRLETVCAGVPYRSAVLYDASFWVLIREVMKRDTNGHSSIGTEQTVLKDFQELVGTQPLPHNTQLTAWLAFLFSGMFARRMDFKPPEAFDVSRTHLVLTDSSGAEHRFSVSRNSMNTGLLGLAP
jgi:hypothetical protein